MRHKKNELKIGDHTCTMLTEPEAKSDFLLIQPTDSHDREELNNEVEYVENHCDKTFMLIAVHIEKWFDELSPWPAPPVFGKTPFGDGANDTLLYIRDELIPYVADKYKDVLAIGDKKDIFNKIILGGYSLAGLFALWAVCQCGFEGIVAASPSVWFTGWTDFAREHPCLAKHAYLSLGDRETHTKTKIMATVGDRLNEEKDILLSQGVDTILEMNPGNHFQDNGVRMGKGFAAVMKNINKKTKS